jgi:hypothetical protein
VFNGHKGVTICHEHHTPTYGTPSVTGSGLDANVSCVFPLPRLSLEIFHDEIYKGMMSESIEREIDRDDDIRTRVQPRLQTQPDTPF